MQNDSTKKRKRLFNYTIMFLADSKDGKIKQMGVDASIFEGILILLIAAIVVLAVLFNNKCEEVAANGKVIEKQKVQIEKLTEENADLASLREELSEKVTILSDTINQKVEEEEALEEANAQAHMPVGFPLSASASLSTSESEEPMVKLTGPEGSSVISAGDGVIASITTDSGYAHCIKIDHENGYVTIYRNDGDVMVKEGDPVVRGAILYVLGEDNTELGYQITYNEKYIDPMELINIDG